MHLLRVTGTGVREKIWLEEDVSTIRMRRVCLHAWTIGGIVLFSRDEHTHSGEASVQVYRLIGNELPDVSMASFAVNTMPSIASVDNSASKFYYQMLAGSRIMAREQPRDTGRPAEGGTHLSGAGYHRLSEEKVFQFLTFALFTPSVRREEEPRRPARMIIILSRRTNWYLVSWVGSPSTTRDMRGAGLRLHVARKRAPEGASWWCNDPERGEARLRSSRFSRGDCY
ncbi:hypothetical protein SCHPADRAFT_893628 [Schizopora paradoxa]|uniref:Uncharacterized protein n=1 Tax=Schizopora paradoxa TaxID=27342 RepID=A0A0H2RA80_9AGAM|nr:hypothetical protein SCHPADRAFT_893628 [Schizopora paradoxa]